MKIRCGTFNLYQFAAPPIAWYEEDNFYSESEWAVKKAWVKTQLDKMNCDIVGFQEVFSPDVLETLTKEAGYDYFAVVDSPKQDDENSKIFSSPVVAIASKHLITNVSSVEFSDKSRDLLPIKKDFNFSRTPIRAEVEINNIGKLIVYVAHLKSKRPTIPSFDFETSDDWNKKVLMTMKARSAGHVISLLQRGAEASELYNNVCLSLNKSPDTPVVLLGDLNDSKASVAIEAISNRERVFEIDETKYKELPLEAKKAIYQYKLFDSFDMAPNPDGLDRIPTHYHKGVGGTLDYIFISNALNVRNKNAAGIVHSHRVFDEHLQKDGVGNHKQSDHAQVVVTLQF